MTLRNKLESDPELLESWSKELREQIAPALEELAQTPAPPGLRRKLIAIADAPTDRESIWSWLYGRTPVLAPALAALLIVVYIPAKMLNTPLAPQAAISSDDSAQAVWDENDLVNEESDLVADLFDRDLELMEELV